MASGSVFSETLHVITNTKLEELAKKRQHFESEYSVLRSEVAKERDALKRLSRLAEGTKSCLGVKNISSSAGNYGARQSCLKTDLENLDQFLEQAKFDPSVSGKALEDWNRKLLQYLDIQSRKFQYADLYGELVKEWLNAEQAVNTGKRLETAEGFEELPSAKRLKARAAWEETRFEPADVDVQALENYLKHIFEADKGSQIALQNLRDKVTDFEAGLGKPNQFGTRKLEVTIRTLIMSDVLSSHKCEALQDFLSNRSILKELADVLNMRMTLDHWSWGDFVAIQQQRRMNGSWTFKMDADLLQNIFLHYIGTQWSLFFKRHFTNMRSDKAAWKSNASDISRTHRLRRSYFLGEPGQRTQGSLASKRRRMHEKQYFAYNLLDYEYQHVEVKEGEEEVYVEENDDRNPFLTQEGVADIFEDEMSVTPVSDGKLAEFFAEVRGHDKDELDWRSTNKQPMLAKQSLLHLLATEIIVNKQLHGEFTCFRTGFKSWTSELSHQAVMTVLKFFGVSEKWMSFFAKFLAAPLRFSEDGFGGKARERRRGAPDSYALSDVFSETLLFCLDFAVNQETNGGLVYRFSDDIWFWNKDYETCAQAWSSITTFAKIFGVKLDNGRTGGLRLSRHNDLKLDHRVPTGEIRWGFLRLNSTSGRFEIDQKMVDGHIAELQTQLLAKKSIIGWIQAYNAYAGTFFSSNFGKAANCFGREHVDQMLATHRRIQETLFDGSNVIEYLKKEITARFAVSDIPDGFLVFPIGLGGLDLKSPFISLLQIRKSFERTPSEIMTQFQDNEREVYQFLKDAFDKGSIGGGMSPGAENQDYLPSDPHTFFPFEEYVAYREDYDGHLQAQLREAYSQLLKYPKVEAISPSAMIRQAVEELSGQDNLGGITSYWDGMDAYWKYAAQIYGPEICEKFGGMNIVDPGLLPIGMVSFLRDRKTKWQE